MSLVTRRVSCLKVQRPASPSGKLLAMPYPHWISFPRDRRPADWVLGFIDVVAEAEARIANLASLRPVVLHRRRELLIKDAFCIESASERHRSLQVTGAKQRHGSARSQLSVGPTGGKQAKPAVLHSAAVYS